MRLVLSAPFAGEVPVGVYDKPRNGVQINEEDKHYFGVCDDGRDYYRRDDERVERHAELERRLLGISGDTTSPAPIGLGSPVKLNRSTSPDCTLNRASLRAAHTV